MKRANRATQTRDGRRHGFTLIEMLVVIAIIAILASTFIPIMAAASDSRRMREGARILSTMLAEAQARAIASNRSVGLLIQRNPNNPAEAMDLFLAESPPPYLGDSVGDMATITAPSSPSQPWTVTFPNQPAPGQPPTALWKSIRPMDLIRFNYRGQMYYLDLGDLKNATIPSGPIPLTPTDYNNAVYPPPGNYPFQVFRQPIKTADAPAQLTDGAVIDMYLSGPEKLSASDNTPDSFAPETYTYSGTTYSIQGGFSVYGYTPQQPTAAQLTAPMMITFSPTGSLQYVYIYGQVLQPLAGVYLLVGRPEGVPPAGSSTLPPGQTPNFAGQDCRWVYVSRQTGLATVAEVADCDPTVPATAVSVSRRFAQSSQNMGGN